MVLKISTDFCVGVARYDYDLKMLFEDCLV